MYLVEYIETRSFLQVTEGADPDDLAWQRYRPAFDTEERAHVEALWLSVDDDGRYVYRVVPA